jgi:hypothetical protein
MSFLETVVEGAAGVALGLKVSEWLQLPQEDALTAIREYVYNNHIDVIDAIDAILLQAAAFQIDPDTKIRLLKRYAYFKIIEYERFGKFRGFPAIQRD